MKRQEKADATRASILAAAAECFSKNEFDAVNVTDITERAGCSVGAFYGHFSSKQALAARVYVDTTVETLKRDTEGAGQITDKEAFVEYLLERSDASNTNPIMNRLNGHCVLTDADNAEIMTYAMRYESLIKNMLAANAPGVSEDTLWSYASIIHALLNANSTRNWGATSFFSFTHQFMRQTILMIMDACRDEAQKP